MAAQRDVGGVGGLEPLLTAKETGTYLRTSLRTVQRLTASGRLRHLRVGGRVCVPESALVEFVANGMLPITSAHAPVAEARRTDA
jgi:excisionase family DNA binding protein